MSRVYSKLLTEWQSPAFGGATSIAVPAGKVWVLRTITCQAPSTLFQPATAFHVTDDYGTDIFSAGLPWTWTNTPYERDTRHVLEAGEHVHLAADVFVWNFRLSGYELSLP